jgi:hypothetical protein
MNDRMAKSSVAIVSQKVYHLLEPLTAEERARAVQAALVLFGDNPLPSNPATAPPPAGLASPSTGSGGSIGTASTFFVSKNPTNKGEILAVAARYRELAEKAEEHTKEDFKKILGDARRNFDSKNFARDMKNARRQSGLFTNGKARGSHVLSYYGQQFVDALPNRDVTSQLQRPKDVRKKGKSKTTK